VAFVTIEIRDSRRSMVFEFERIRRLPLQGSAPGVDR
jgi:hypothetical protein